MKYLFLTFLIIFLYCVLFRLKVTVEHRHFYDKKPDTKKTSRKDTDYTDYEEV